MRAGQKPGRPVRRTAGQGQPLRPPAHAAAGVRFEVKLAGEAREQLRAQGGAAFGHERQRLLQQGHQRLVGLPRLDHDGTEPERRLGQLRRQPARSCQVRRTRKGLARAVGVAGALARLSECDEQAGVARRLERFQQALGERETALIQRGGVLEGELVDGVAGGAFAGVDRRARPADRRRGDAVMSELVEKPGIATGQRLQRVGLASVELGPLGRIELAVEPDRGSARGQNEARPAPLPRPPARRAAPVPRARAHRPARRYAAAQGGQARSRARAPRRRRERCACPPTMARAGGRSSRARLPAAERGEGSSPASPMTRASDWMKNGLPPVRRRSAATESSGRREPLLAAASARVASTSSPLRMSGSPRRTSRASSSSTCGSVPGSPMRWVASTSIGAPGSRCASRSSSSSEVASAACRSSRTSTSGAAGVRDQQLRHAVEEREAGGVGFLAWPFDAPSSGTSARRPWPHPAPPGQRLRASLGHERSQASIQGQ